MAITTTYPKIRHVVPLADKVLRIEFANGQVRLYDCKPLLDTEPFVSLRDESFFRMAHAETHGYGVVWNDTVDLAESEVWLNGKPV